MKNFAIILLVFVISEVSRCEPSLDYKKLAQTASNLGGQADKIDDVLKELKKTFLSSINEFIRSKSDHIAIKDVTAAWTELEKLYRDVKTTMKDTDVPLSKKRELYAKVLFSKPPNDILHGVYKNMSVVKLSGKFRDDVYDFHHNHLYKNHGLDCQGYVAMREKYHVMFCHLIALELKGWMVLTYVYSLNVKNFTPADVYTFEDHVKSLVAKNNQHLARVKKYLETVKKITQGLPGDVVRCENLILKPKSFKILTELNHVFDKNWLKVGEGVREK